MAGVEGELDGAGGVVPADAEEHRHPALDALQGELDQLLFLVIRQGRGFAGGARDPQVADAALELKVDKRRE